MKRSALVMTAFVIASSTPLLAGADSSQVDGDWQFVKQSDGIVVQRRIVAGSSLKEFRGHAVVQAPVAAILAVFSDVPR
ncbi:MAG: hypothetical protein JWM53_3642, partial [bacterium]|nr:hypothetical protein [bacterium]